MIVAKAKTEKDSGEWLKLPILWHDIFFYDFYQNAYNSSTLHGIYETAEKGTYC